MLLRQRAFVVLCASCLLTHSWATAQENEQGEKALSETQNALQQVEDALQRTDSTVQEAETQSKSVQSEMPDAAIAEETSTDPVELARDWEKIFDQAMQEYKFGELEVSLINALQARELADRHFGLRDERTLRAYLLQALLYGELGELEIANELYQETLVIAIEQQGTNSKIVLQILDQYGGFFTELGEYEMADVVYEKAYLFSTEVLGTQDPRTTLRLQTLANNDGELQRYELAEKRLQDAQTTLVASVGEEALPTIKVLEDLAQLYQRQGKLRPALELLEQSYALRTEVQGPEETQTLETKERLAELYQQLGRPDEAGPMFLEVIASAEQLLGIADPLVIDAKSHLAQLYENTNNFVAALRYYQEVYEIDRQILGDAHPNTAGDLNNLAGIYRRLGQLQQSEASYRQAMKVMSAVLGEDSPQTISIMNNLALVLESQGLYDEAEPLYQKALSLSQVRQGMEHPTSLALNNNIAMLYEAQGDFSRAERIYQQVIELNKQVFGPTHPNTVASINNLAYLYLIDQKPEQAETHFLEAYEIWKKLYGEKHQDTLKALNNSGRVQTQLGELNQAEETLVRALELRTDLFGGREHEDVLRSMNDLAALYVEQGREEKALALFQETLELQGPVLGELHPYTFETLNNLANLQQEMGDLDDAYETHQLGYQRRNQFLNRILWVAGDNTRQSYINLYRPELDAYIRLLIELDDKRTAPDIFDISLQRKGLLLKITSETQQVVQMADSPELQAITEKLTAARKELAALTLSGPTPETRNNFPQLINDLENRVNNLQLRLGEASAVFRQAIQQVSVEDVIDAVGEEHALADFFAYRDENDEWSLCVIILNDGKLYFYNYEELEPFKDMIMELRDYMMDVTVIEDDIKPIAQELYEPLWDPITEFLEDKDSIFLIPDSVLNVLPFDALVDFDDQYLIETLNLRLISSARDLVIDPLEPAEGDVLIIAGPDYDSEEISNSPEARMATSSSRSATVNSGIRMGNGLRGLNFSPLPGAEKEGEVIEEVVGNKERSTTFFTRAAAEEKELRSYNAQKIPEILHIATHGFFLKEQERLAKRIMGMQRGSQNSIPPPADNPLLRAGLAFAGLNPNAPLLGEIDTDNDGVLTAMEVLSLNLTGTRLVILSACETGLGEIHEGEGVYGLRRSFQEAGVDSVINSFWEVSDDGTQLLMTKFYDKYLDGISPREALREARLEMVEDFRWSSPFYWGAFAMVGRRE
jgi:CHAT domain-containing protein/Tfp pilus assembly protein PilF